MKWKHKYGGNLFFNVNTTNEDFMKGIKHFKVWSRPDNIWCEKASHTLIDKKTKA